MTAEGTPEFVILRSASALGCAVVWSEDLNLGQDFDGVRVANPFTP